MGHLDGLSVEELHDDFKNVAGNEPIERLLPAIAYKNGLASPNLQSPMMAGEERSTTGSCDMIRPNHLHKL